MTNKIKNIDVGHLFTCFSTLKRDRALLKKGSDILITGIVLLTVSDASRRSNEEDNMVEAYCGCQEPQNLVQNQARDVGKAQ